MTVTLREQHLNRLDTHTMSENIAQVLTALTATLGITPQQLGQALVAQGVLVDVKVGVEKVAYTKANGDVIMVTPKQFAHYTAFAEAAKAKAAAVSPEQRAAREAAQAAWTEKAKARREARVAEGKFATTLDRKVVNRSVAEMVRRGLVVQAKFEDAVKGIQAGTISIPEDILILVTEQVQAKRAAARKAKKGSK